FTSLVEDQLMKNASLIATVLLSGMILTGCVPSEFFVKSGVTFDRYERDSVGCATQASQAVPTNTQVGWAPYVGLYSVDANAGLRGKNLEICMRDRGYQKVSIPYCTGVSLKAATDAAKLPQDRNKSMTITKASCYVLGAAGTPSLYTP
ncbi:MAG: hypothetical protein WCC57_20530, partial [Paracoccaceae bacterium]